MCICTFVGQHTYLQFPANLGRHKGQQKSLSTDEKDLKSVVLEHVPPPVDLHHLAVLPGQHGHLLVPGEHLGDVGVTQGLVANKVAPHVGCEYIVYVCTHQ